MESFDTESQKEWNSIESYLYDFYTDNMDYYEAMDADICESNEGVDFDHLTLEISSWKPVTPIIMQPHGPRALTEPRLDLHLIRPSGVQNTRRQLGRIARYAQARRLHESHPILCATSYSQLTGVVQRLIPGMIRATDTYIGFQDIKDEITEGYNIFTSRNPGRKRGAMEINSMVMPTEQFIHDWVQQD